MRKLIIAIIKTAIALLCSAAAALLFAVPLGADNEVEGEAAVPSVEEVIKSGFYSFRESIDISAYCIPPEELGAIFSSVIKDDPYLFFVDGQMSYSYKPGGYVLSLKPKYSMVGREAFDAFDECRRYIREVATLAMEWDGDDARALFLHDYVCSAFEYDTNLESDSMYSMIKSGKGTCEAYTDMYMALLRECGIDSHFVASDTIAHIWNYVRIDGEWYHADLTWDDTQDGLQRRHFLLSDKMASERGHRDWYSVSDVICESEKYSEYDFSGLLHGRYSVGDLDHNGMVGLKDILLLGISDNICASCSDINCDSVIDEKDAEGLRMLILQGK